MPVIARRLGTPLDAADHFVQSLQSADRHATPYSYWLLEDALPLAMVQAMADLPFPAPTGLVFDGKRESNNSTRVYFTPENQARFPVCAAVVDCFNDPMVKEAITAATGADLRQGQLRVEYCQDIDGFWLEPHVDISVKLFTMLIYLSDDPALHDAGTDVYDASPEHRLVVSAPYGQNKGMIFIPAYNTWHGLGQRPINGLRKSIIVNYVTDEWRAKGELA